MKIKKRNFLPLVLILLLSIYTFRNYFIAYYYSNLNQNEEIKILTIDETKYKTYQDILNIEEFKNRPSFIYFNTRLSYERLEKDTPILNKIYDEFNEEGLNIIYIANGLRDEEKEEKKWIVKINQLTLKGTHISLSVNYTDFYTYFREESNSKGVRTTHFPHYLLANKNGIITDTIFEEKINLNKIEKLIEKRHHNNGYKQ